MKNILLLTAVSCIMTIGTMFPFHPENVAHITLPEVEITATRALPEINLPTVTIRAAKFQVNTVVLPEVVITASKFRKV